MKKLLIIADDLTGALDTGVHFANQGISTQVLPVVNKKVFRMFYEGRYSVLVVNTESRHLPEDEAYSIVKSVIEHAKKAGFDFYYKKTDSTLRGNVGAELEAVISGLSLSELPFVPAYPKLGRNTVGGYHYVDKTPLHHTKFSEDPLNPVNTSYIPELLSRQTQLGVRIISREDLKHNNLILSGEHEILLFDCKSDSNLETIARKLNQHKLIHAVSGSAALSGYLVEYLDLDITDHKNTDLRGPVLIVNGSLNEVSLQQAEKLAQSDILTWTFQPGELLSDNDAIFNRLYQQVVREGGKGNDVLIRSIENREVHDRYLRDHISGTKLNEVYHKASSKLGKWIAEIINTGKFRTIILFGGDTLMAVIGALNTEGLFPQRELLPGVVVSGLPDPFHQLHLITKPGGYGKKDIFTDIFRFINTKES